MQTFFFYLIIELISLVFLWLSRKAKNKVQRSVFMMISAFALFLPAAIRGKETGADTYRYSQLFNRIKDNTVTTTDVKWVGMIFINFFHILINALGFNYQVIFAIFAALSSIALIKAVCSNSSAPVFSLYAFVSFCLYYQFFNQFRQTLAICIVLYSLKYFVNKEFIKYALTIMLAAFFHPSAIIMLPFYFIGAIKINRKVIALYVLSAIVMYAAYSIIEPIVFSTSYGSIYKSYDMYGLSMSISSVLNFMVRIIMIVFCLYLYRGKSFTRKDAFLITMAIMSIIFQLLTLRSYVFGRVTTYFFIFYIYTLPTVVDKIKSTRTKQFARIMVCLVLIAYHSVYYFSPQGAISGGYQDYSTFLEEK